MTLTPVCVHWQLVQGEVSTWDPLLSKRPPTWQELGGGPALRALPCAPASLHAFRSMPGTLLHKIRGFLKYHHKNFTRCYLAVGIGKFSRGAVGLIKCRWLNVNGCVHVVAEHLRKAGLAQLLQLDGRESLHRRPSLVPERVFKGL